ncbi:MAG: alpha,alpha-trehalase TreF [Bacteroidota bacterium]
MPATPFFFIEQLSPLYEDVQSAGIFPDSKYFVDSIPLSSTENILLQYEKEKYSSDFVLKDFVQTYFHLPAETDDSYRSGDKPLPEHLAELWDVLTRGPDEQGGTLIPLPYPYIVPGGRFREVYYWDSYFTMLGLQVSKRIDIIENMINNFAYLIDTVGFIPNGNRTYYLGRSQPPFFALMLALLAEERGENILLKYLPQLEKEYAFWMDGTDHLSASNRAYRRVVLMQNGSVLNRYWDDNDTPRPEAYTEDKYIASLSGRDANEVYRHIRAAAESGWDFSSRWFRETGKMETIQTTDLIPVDLNCLLLWTELSLSGMYENAGNKEKSKHMLVQFGKRKEAIDKYCRNEENGFYFDYHHKDEQQSSLFTLAGMFAFFIPIADWRKSVDIPALIEEKFLQSGGLATTLNTTGQQWDAPNGWAPLQWITYKGLKRLPYGHEKFAEKIRQNWMRTNEKVYAATGKMMEKYNVSDTETKAGGGEYPNQDGFGWTNGVYLKFLAS